MKRIIVILGFLVGIAGYFTFVDAGTFEAFSNSGIYDTDKITFLSGDVYKVHGDLVQLIFVGSDGQIDPADSLGNATDDDLILGETFIGYGYPFNPNQGKFVKIFTHERLITGAMVYVRAWNASELKDRGVAYGNSEMYTLVSDFDSHDFGSWSTTERSHAPVELASFIVEAKPGSVELHWMTFSETDNLGFNIYRSETPNGTRNKMNDKMIQGAITSTNQNDYTFNDIDIKNNTVYFYWLADVAASGEVTYHGPKSITAITKPDNYELAQNYPNPFNPSTTIFYALKEPGMTKLVIFNIRGQVVRELVNTQQLAGHYSIEWDGRDQNGFVVPTGMYIYSIEANEFKASRSMTLAK